MSTGIEYLQTHARLKQVAIKELGEMAIGGQPYSYFMGLARQTSEATGIKNPKIMLAITFKPGMSPVGTPEIVYPIADFEWDAFVADIKSYCAMNPTVWVVDGDKYTAPI